MRITITGRNIDITDGLRSAVEDKLSKLEKYFTPDTDVFVTLSVEKERQKIESVPICLLLGLEPVRVLHL